MIWLVEIMWGRKNIKEVEIGGKISAVLLLKYSSFKYIFISKLVYSAVVCNRYKMDLKDNTNIAVNKNSIMFLRICFLFPNKEEIENPEKNVFIKFAFLNMLASYYPIGVILHLVINLRSKSKICIIYFIILRISTYINCFYWYYLVF